jgi:hypothetical protein
MESFQGDYTIASIQETAIMDVFRYKLEMPSQA